MIAKYDIDPDDFYFANTLNAAAIAALPEEVNGKNRIEAEKKLKSNLYLCIGARHRDYSKQENRRSVLKRNDTHEYWTKCKMFLDAREM